MDVYHQVKHRLQAPHKVKKRSIHIGNPVMRTDGRTVAWLPKFLGCMNTHIFLVDTLNSSTQCIFLLVRSFIDPTFCGIFFCGPLQFKCQIFFPILLPHNVTLPSNAFYGGNVACTSVGLFFFSFFFYCRSLSLRWPQEFLIFSPPL